MAAGLLLGLGAFAFEMLRTNKGDALTAIVIVAGVTVTLAPLIVFGFIVFFRTRSAPLLPLLRNRRIVVAAVDFRKHRVSLNLYQVGVIALVPILAVFWFAFIGPIFFRVYFAVLGTSVAADFPAAVLFSAAFFIVLWLMVRLLAPPSDGAELAPEVERG
jgi:hypothetical protein